MRLLFDANLSPALTEAVAAEYPGSVHVEQFGLRTPDNDIWQKSIALGIVIVTKDTDFETVAMLMGPPGKVILITLGNCSTWVVASLLRAQLDRIEAFGADPHETMLVLP